MNGSVQVIGLNLNPTVKLAEGVVDTTSSKVATGAATRIIAGVNNAANLFVIPAELLEELGYTSATLPAAGAPLRFDSNSPAVRAILEKLLGAGKTSLDGAPGTVNIDVRYELTAFSASDIKVNVTAGMIIEHNGSYYRYNSPNSRDLDLAAEDYANSSYWMYLSNPTAAQVAMP